MPDRMRVAVICGGTSSEREISLKSGQAMLGQFDPGRFLAELVDLADILARRKWPIEKLVEEFDVAFLALHGQGGEDGRLQGMLELFEMPYTGSGVLASALAMDKSMAKKVYRDAGLPVAREVVFSAVEAAAVASTEAADRVMAELGYPVVVKADSQGSTRGVQLVRDRAAFESAWGDALSFRGGILIEEFVKGREFTVPVLGGSEPQAFPVIEIVPKAAEFFTYEAKYSPGGSEEIVPARIDAPSARALADLGLRAHLALGCWGVSRTDIFIREDGQPSLIETNTLPGMTAASLLPKAVLAAGWTLPQLAASLIDWALERAALAARPEATPAC